MFHTTFYNNEKRAKPLRKFLCTCKRVNILVLQCCSIFRPCFPRASSVASSIVRIQSYDTNLFCATTAGYSTCLRT